MLVLSRHKDERVFIVVPGRKEPIVITQVDIRGDKSRLGFDADSDIQVYREEVWNAIQREGQKREV